MAVRTGIIWTDPQGESVLHVITSATGAGSIAADLEAKSNAFRSQQFAGTNLHPSSSGTVATYPTVRVTAELIFVNATGSTARIYIPAPQASIFLSDGVTVDPTQITSIISACVGNLLCGDSTPATAFQGGQLLATKLNAIASLQVFTP